LPLLVVKDRLTVDWLGVSDPPTAPFTVSVTGIESAVPVEGVTVTVPVHTAVESPTALPVIVMPVLRAELIIALPESVAASQEPPQVVVEGVTETDIWLTLEVVMSTELDAVAPVAATRLTELGLAVSAPLLPVPVVL
jgi:hypothetical protein